MDFRSGFSKVLPNQILVTGIFLVFLGFLSTLWNRYIYIDDAWFGEQAFWLAKDGIPRTESLKGYFDWDVHLLVYHRFNILFGAFLIKVFGWSVNLLRVPTLLILGAFFFLLYLYHQNKKEFFGPHAYWIWLAFLFANPLIVYLGFTFRPEILVMLLGFLSWWMVEKSINQSFSFPVAFFGGMCAGLAFFTHLNGLIFPVAGFLVLLINQKFKPLIVFGVSAFCVSCLFFYDLWQPGRWGMFLFQMKNWPDPVGSNYTSGGIFAWFLKAVLKLLDEQQRFFWSYKVWVVSILYILSLLLYFKTLWKNHRNLLLYLFILNLSLNLLGSYIAERFLIYLLPYMAIAVGLAFQICAERKEYKILWLFRGLACIQFVFCWVMIFWLWGKSRDYVGMHTQILKEIPEKTSPILVDYPLVFNGLESHKLITFKLFEYLEVTHKKKFDATSFTRKCHALGIAYIVLPSAAESIENTNYSVLFEGLTEIPHYFRWKETNGYLILKHK